MNLADVLASEVVLKKNVGTSGGDGGSIEPLIVPITLTSDTEGTYAVSLKNIANHMKNGGNVVLIIEGVGAFQVVASLWDDEYNNGSAYAIIPLTLNSIQSITLLADGTVQIQDIRIPDA